MSGYEIRVILEQDGITVGSIGMDPGELRVMAVQGIKLSGKPTTEVRKLSEVAYAYYSAGDQHRPAGICFGLTKDGASLDRVAVARRVIGVVKGANQ